MIYKVYARVFVLAAMLIAVFATSGSAAAGGVCGGTYIVDPGDTFSKIASKCGTSVSAITSANPGVNEPLKTGQALTVPGITYGAQAATNTPIATYNYYPPTSYTKTYIVQVGDTFSDIAARYGISVNDLWAANPYIVDINYLYVGQLLYVPASSSVASTPLAPLSYGSVPFGAPKGKVTLSNKANGDVYVSLQGITRDGIHVINEYPVSGKMVVKIPSGAYTYVAWVGGLKFEGWFQLGNDGEHKITFYEKKVVVE